MALLGGTVTIGRQESAYPWGRLDYIVIQKQIKVREKKNVYRYQSPPFSKKAMQWGKKWPVQMNSPFFAVEAYVPGGGGVRESGRKKGKKCLPAGTGTKIYFSRKCKCKCIILEIKLKAIEECKCNLQSASVIPKGSDYTLEIIPKTIKGVSVSVIKAEINSKII